MHISKIQTIVIVKTPSCQRMSNRHHYRFSSWASYQILKMRVVHRECRKRFPRNRQRKPLMRDSGMHHGTCVTHVPWCMSASLTRGVGENVPGIHGTCATHNFTYLARDPLDKTVSPFLSDKPSSSNGKIILCDDGNIISDSSQVANIFYMYYSSISEYDCTPDGLDCLTFEDAVLKHASHERISLIKQHTAPCKNFRFKVVAHETFQCYIDQLKSNKAAGFDGLQAKFLKLSGYKYISFLCDIFNKCVCTNVFPSYMKLAEISPIYKKDDNFRKENYRSVKPACHDFKGIWEDPCRSVNCLLWTLIELLFVCLPERL